MTKNKSRPLILLAAGLLWVSFTQAQESVNTSGGNAFGNGGTVAYSIGLVTYTTHAGSTGSMAQGVQHAYEIFMVGIKETAADITLTVFPNPTSHILTLKISEYNNEKLSYQLFDLQGRLLKSEQIVGAETQINTENLPASTYLMSVLNQENKNVQSFKIIKNQEQ